MASTKHRTKRRELMLEARPYSRREREEMGLAPTLRAARRTLEPPPFPGAPEHFAWFALHVAAQREEHVAAALHGEGLAAFNPVEQVPMRANRYLRHRRAMRARALCASLCFVGFPAGVAVPWGRVIGPPGVRSDRLGDVIGVIGMDGKPSPLRLDALLALRALHGRSAAPRDFAPAVGEAAMIAVGQFAGLIGTVIELRKGDARLRLFGEGVFSGRAEAVVPELWLEEV